MLLIIDFIDCPGRDEMYGSDAENKTTSLLVFKAFYVPHKGDLIWVYAFCIHWV